METARIEGIDKNKVICESLCGYLQAVAEHMENPPGDAGSVLLWRGQANAAWPLWPSLQVEWKEQPDKIEGVERRMFDDFVGTAKYLLPVPLDNDWDRLSIAQHYGMRTRLLDWTVNPLVALWFAVAEEREDAAAVWLFRPLPDRMVDDGKRDGSPFKQTVTRAFRPVTHSTRIALQAGWHTVHSFKKGVGLRAIDRMRVHAPQLVLFEMPSKNRRRVLRELEGTGVSAATVYGDLPSLCRSVSDRYRYTHVHRGTK